MAAARSGGANGIGFSSRACTLNAGFFTPVRVELCDADCRAVAVAQSGRMALQTIPVSTLASALPSEYSEP